MKLIKKIISASAIILASLSMSSQAALVSTDWKISGDSLASLDDVSGKEWLDLTQTDGLSITQVKGLLDTTYAGWRLPTAIEVREMYQNTISAWTDNGSDEQDFSGNAFWTQYMNVIAHLGKTYDDNNGATYSYGWVEMDNGNSSRNGLFDNRYDFRIRFGQGNFGQDYSDHLTGVFLVSDGGTTLSSIENPELNSNNDNAPINQVPLPATALLFGLSGLLFFRNRNK